MKAIIENYRGFEISFDTDTEAFYGISDQYDKDFKKPSYASAKKFIDEFLKDNQNFKPFWVEGNPDSWSSNSKIKIIGIRKDGRFIYEDLKGQKQQISQYDEKDYILPNPANDPIKQKLKDLRLQEHEIDKEIRETKTQFIIKTLEDWKAEYLNQTKTV